MNSCMSHLKNKVNISSISFKKLLFPQNKNNQNCSIVRSYNTKDVAERTQVYVLIDKMVLAKNKATSNHKKFSTVQSSRSILSDSLQSYELQHSRPPCPSPTTGVYSNSDPLSWWCHQTILSSVVPFFSCLQSFPASVSFQWISSSHQVAKVLEFQLQQQFFQWIFRTDYPLGWTGWISLWSKGLSRVFSKTTDQMHQVFSTQLSL